MGVYKIRGCILKVSGPGDIRGFREGRGKQWVGGLSRRTPQMFSCMQGKLLVKRELLLRRTSIQKTLRNLLSALKRRPKSPTSFGPKPFQSALRCFSVTRHFLPKQK